MLDNANDVQTPRNERSSSCFEDLDRLLADPEYGAAELARLHEQSKNQVPDWEAALNYRRRNRPKIIAFLVKAFEAIGLRDEWLVDSICLLDRISSRRAAQEGELPKKAMLVETLCAVLMALKISSAEAETEMSVKHIIFNLARNSADSGDELWPLIFQTELRVLPLIDFRVAQPTAMDLVGRLSLDVALAAPETDAAAGTWPGLERMEVAAYARATRDGRVPVADIRPRFMVFSRFLVELALLHEEDDAFRLATRAPLVLALAAVHVALDSFTGCPPESCWRVVFSAKQLLAEREVEQLAECVPLLRKLWSAGSSGDAVVQKWLRRQNTGDQLLPKPPRPQPFADMPAAPVPRSARTPPRRPTRWAAQQFSSSKEVRPAATAAAATHAEPACRMPMPLLGLLDASARDVVSSQTSETDDLLQRYQGPTETIPQQELECGDSTYAGVAADLSEATAAPAVAVVPTTSPTRSSFAPGKEPRSLTPASRFLIEALEARRAMEKDALRVRAYLSACKTRPPHPAALNGRQCPPRQMLESDGFDNRGPADKMHAVDHMDATSCRIPHQVDTQWPAGHMNELKRRQTNEKTNVQSLSKRKKSTFSQCEWAAPVPSSAADKMHAMYQMGTTGVPNGYRGCTKLVPRVYQMGTTGVPNGYHRCTNWVPRVYQMGTTGAPHGYVRWHLSVWYGSFVAVVCSR